MSRFVLDASVALCWFFPGQKTPYTEAVLNQVAGGDEAIVPGIWPLEMVNSLLVAVRHKAITPAQFDEFITDLKDLPIAIDLGGGSRTYSSIVRLCRQFQLSSYDATYLDLALIEGIPLASLDKNLRAAAKASGVELRRP